MRTYRAAPAVYAMLGTITCALGAAWLVPVWWLEAPWQPIFVPVAGCVIAAAWLSRFRVSLNQDEVVLVRPFAGARRCSRRDILSVEFSEENGRGRGTMALCIRLSSGEVLRVNVKVFSARAVQELLALATGAKAR